MNVSVVIPNWNGQRLLEKNLPAVIASNPFEIIVCDDGSSDKSVEFIKKEYSHVRLVENPHIGFGKNCNSGVATAGSEIVVLLNNDVAPEKDFLNPLIKDFGDPKIFAVSLNEKQWSWARGKWVRGFVEHEPGPKTKVPHISFWASGGSGAFNKKIWEELGGFDDLYSPFYWEDIDLSYRAWKRGYKIIWEPMSKVVHRHEGTIGSNFSKNYIDFISQRNRLLFIWKNITDAKMSQDHKAYLLKRLSKNLGYLRVFFSAFVKLPQILPKRKIEKQEQIMTDEEIFDLFAK